MRRYVGEYNIDLGKGSSEHCLSLLSITSLELETSCWHLNDQDKNLPAQIFPEDPMLALSTHDATQGPSMQLSSSNSISWVVADLL